MDHRKISPIEMYSVARNDLNFYKTVSFYIRFETLQFSRLDWEKRIEKALRSMVEIHPRLRLQVDLSRTPAYYIVLPINTFDHLPIRIIERNDDDEDEEFLDQIIENESNTGFIYNDQSPLWRIVLIGSLGKKTFDVILSWNHAIGDGISGMAFFTTFVQCLSGKEIERFSLDNDRPSFELLPSKLPPLSSFISDIIEKLLLPNFLRGYFFPKSYWIGDRRLIGKESFQTRVISFQLSDIVLDLLYKKCQNERTTIHTAILSAFLLSISAIFERKDTEFRCGTAVNIRRYCQPVIPNEQIGVFQSGAETSHYIPYSEDLIQFFWPLARQIKEQLNTEIDHSILPLIQSLKFVSNWEEFLLNQRKTLPNGYSHSVEVSNLLRWSLASSDPTWKILHGGFNQSANIIGSALTASVVTVNEILKVYISFQADCFPNVDRVKSMRDQMKQFLIDASYLERKPASSVRNG